MNELDELLNVLAEAAGITHNPSDPFGFDPLPPERYSTSEVYSPTCYICNDPDYATHGLPLCYPCELCGGHVAADDTICDVCGWDQTGGPDNAESFDELVDYLSSFEIVRGWVQFGGERVCIKRNGSLVCGGTEIDKPIKPSIRFPTCYHCKKVVMKEYHEQVKLLRTEAVKALGRAISLIKIESVGKGINNEDH